MTDGKINEGDSSSVDLVVLNVLRRIKDLEKSDKLNWKQYQGEDARLLFGVSLFDVYYRFTEEFDRLMQAQIAAGDESCPVPFFKEVMALLLKRGFDEEEAIRFFAMFYQVRRAFHFIHYYLVGQSPSMEKLRCDLWNNVFTFDIRDYEMSLWNRMEDFSTLILGETGSGKGAAAAAIGRSGFIPFDPGKGAFEESFLKSFIGINLSQYPETLIESELFGHKKGAFTGATDDQQGLFSLCTAHGAVFLDEIGDVPVQVQVKLLQVLQERTFTPIGQRSVCRFNGRVIAATNKSLNELLEKGAFREDFYYRLCSEVIQVPPLRQRLEEDPQEMTALLNLLVRRTLGQDSREWVGRIHEILQRDLGDGYSWPGNVRELEQAVRRIMLSREYHGQLYKKTESKGLQQTIQDGVVFGSLSARELLSYYCASLYERYGTIEEVARRTKLDRRTVKKHLVSSGYFPDPE